MNHTVSRLLLASLFSVTHLAGLAEAGPRHASGGAIKRSEPRPAAGKIFVSRTWKNNKGRKTTELQLKITRGNAKHTPGYTQYAADVADGIVIFDGSFETGVKVDVPGMGAVSPLSATIWEVVTNHGARPAAGKPLRIKVTYGIIKMVEGVREMNPDLTSAQQLAQVIEIRGQGDVWGTLKALGYNPDTLTFRTRRLPDDKWGQHNMEAVMEIRPSSP